MGFTIVWPEGVIFGSIMTYHVQFLLLVLAGSTASSRTWLTTCERRTVRADVLKGAITEADFAADLAQVIIGVGNVEYLEPARFFANTYPTRGLKNLHLRRRRTSVTMPA